MGPCIRVASELTAVWIMYTPQAALGYAARVTSSSHRYSVCTRHDNMADKRQPQKVSPGTEGGTTVQYMFGISVGTISQQRGEIQP